MVFIITGASKGIGNYLFHALMEKGYKVIGTYNSTKLEENNSNFYKVNVSNFSEVEKWIVTIEDQLENVVLINCAAINYNSFAHKADVSLWSKVIDVNLKGTFYIIRSLLPIMREQNFGRIINFSSVITKYPTCGVSAYAASKAALTGLTKSLSAENSWYGITVNTINLGYVNIGMGINDVPIPYQKKMKEEIPCHRFCKPEEVLNTIEYLVKTEYITGSLIDINGGLI